MAQNVIVTKLKKVLIKSNDMSLNMAIISSKITMKMIFGHTKGYYKF